MLHVFAIQEAQLPRRRDVLNSQTVFSDDTKKAIMPFRVTNFGTTQNKYTHLLSK